MPRDVSRLKRVFIEKATLVEAIVLLAVAKVGLLWVRFSRLRRRFEISTRKQVRSGDGDKGAYLVAKSINRAGRRILGDSSCLPQALAGVWMLRRRGYPAELKFGVRKADSDQFVAHAWVEYDHKIVIGLNQDPSINYVMLEKQPQSNSRI
jgi:hypothetical protein